MQDYYTQYSDDSIYIVNGYRSKLEQDIVYQQAVDNNLPENLAGCSDFHTGYSFDLAVLPTDTAIQDFATYANASWIIENCANYGFIQRYPENKKSITGLSVPNQFRYVSVPHSLYMKDNNLCLEEYISMLEGYQFGNKALRFTYNDQEYMVYVCEASNSDSDTVEVYVPKDKNYTVCGNNVNGFIVTVEV
jgi:D-alanyl-D-alanine carboxypeptidase